jgi:hypothetical protein
MAGKLVHVQQARRKLDWSAVSAALDMNPSFALGHGPHAPCAWHAIRVHNFCRPMGSPEAICERVGSFMRQQWSPGRHLDAGTLMDEVLLRDAQVTCLGSSRDERICRDVAQCMHFLGRRPLVTEATKQTRRRQGVASSSSLPVRRLRQGAARADDSSSSEAGRDGEADWLADEWPDRHLLERAVRQRSQKATPELDEAAVHQAVLLRGAHGRVQQLPLFQVDARVEARSRADSVKRSALQDWLSSDAGAAWLAEKRQRHV